MFSKLNWRILARHCGAKRTYTILEDNDPTGYKSNTAKRAKRELGIQPIEFPTYSPDLNPLDFSFWAERDGRMLAAKVPRTRRRSSTKPAYAAPH